MTFIYYVSYDEWTDEFFARVDDGSKTGEPIFTIDDTEEMISYIQTNVMKHIDDTDGLKKHLVMMSVIKPDDEIMMSEMAIV